MQQVLQMARQCRLAAMRRHQRKSSAELAAVAPVVSWVVGMLAWAEGIHRWQAEETCRWAPFVVRHRHHRFQMVRHRPALVNFVNLVNLSLRSSVAEPIQTSLCFAMTTRLQTLLAMPVL